MAAGGVGQQILLASSVDKAILDNDVVGKTFQKEAHGIARLKRNPCDPLVSGQDCRLHLHRALRQKTDLWKRCEINGSLHNISPLFPP